MELYLLRHGETEDNVKQVGQGHLPGKLTRYGKRQAELVAKRLCKLPFHAVYCSDLKRAMETLEPFLLLSSHQPVYTNELREYDLGRLQGLSYHEINAAKQSDPEFFRPEGGESLADLRLRARRFVNTLLEKHPEETLLACSHGAWIKMLLGSLLNLSFAQALSLKPRNTSLSLVRWTPENGWQLSLFDCTEHLNLETDGNCLFELG